MASASPVLVVGGLPAAGKSTIAQSFAARVQVPYLRVDRIEQALVTWSALTHPVGAAGYAVAHAMAHEQLPLGLDVIVECVNPSALTRDAWQSTAKDAGSGIVEVEVVCTDRVEHRRRAETRLSDVDGLIIPTWQEITQREYERWTRPHLVVDSANTSPGTAADRIASEVAATRQ